MHLYFTCFVVRTMWHILPASDDSVSRTPILPWMSEEPLIEPIWSASLPVTESISLFLSSRKGKRLLVTLILNYTASWASSNSNIPGASQPITAFLAAHGFPVIQWGASVDSPQLYSAHSRALSVKRVVWCFLFLSLSSVYPSLVFPLCVWDVECAVGCEQLPHSRC